MIEIEYKDIVKKYPNDAFSLKEINFKINAGEFLVLLGPSGCGKSTILRLTAGLEDIASGDLFFNKVRMNDVHASKRNVGMVFQNYALYPHMTVAENIAFPLKIAKMSKSEIDKRVKEVAQIIDLTEYLNRKPKELSGGQRQRVALGRAVSRNPHVFLFDEPLSNLDAKLRVQMRTEIMNLHRTIGTTSLYVTHDQTEAMTMGERLVILKDGAIQQIDSPDEMYNNPLNTFVAGFIGSPQMNFFNGNIISDDQTKFVENNSNIKFNILDEIYSTLKNGTSNITIGIRPEHLILNSENLSEFYFNIEILNIEYLGYEQLIYFKSDNTLKCMRANLKNKFKIGENISISFNQKDLKFFDDKGIRIL